MGIPGETAPCPSAGNVPTIQTVPPPCMDEVIRKYDIRSEFRPHLKNMIGLKFVVVLDDSSSMRSLADGGGVNGWRTRWDEACERLAVIHEFATAARTTMDIYRLNGDDFMSATADTIRMLSGLKTYGGSTPLTCAMERVKRANPAGSGPTLVLIITDGAPDDQASFRRQLEDRRDDMYVTIQACTDDDAALAYLAKWDKIIPRLDVTDDYRSELGEIRARHGTSFPFSYGDYWVKVILGAVVPEIDAWDESGPSRRLEQRSASHQDGGCCVLL